VWTVKYNAVTYIRRRGGQNNIIYYSDDDELNSESKCVHISSYSILCYYIITLTFHDRRVEEMLLHVNSKGKK